MLLRQPSNQGCKASTLAHGRQDAQRLKGVVAPLSRNDLGVKVDYRKVFNLMVCGLFGGVKPPYLAGTLQDVPSCIKSYESVATVLRNSEDVDGYYRFNQAASLLKKLEGVPFEGYNPDITALNGWFASEEECRKTNAILWDMWANPLTHAETPLTQLITRMRKDIASLLGDTPPSMEKVLSFGNFGPGTSLSNRIDQVDPILKPINPSCLSSLRLELFQVYCKTQLGDVVFSGRSGIKNTSAYDRQTIARVAMEGTEFVDHAKLAIVPKNLWTGRSIEVGGCMTTWIQQCYDGWIRSNLQRWWGIDLSDQLPNQHMAFLGSLRNAFRHFCTIDLTSASDRISLILVALLLPPKWLALLLRMTNRTTLIPRNLLGEKEGRLVKMEKFSAMGNSLTFSLQTMIFGSLVRSVLREQGLKLGWRVYGDDIIVEKPIYDEVVEGLRLLGFEPNPMKSYSTGYFRESCGADYMLGTNVRALYIKDPIKTVPDVYKYLNLIQLHVKQSPERAAFWKPLYGYLWKLLPNRWKVVGVPSRCLDGYVWAPLQMDSRRKSSYPRVIVVKGVPGNPVPEPFDYFRVLMTRHSEDSSIRCNAGDELPVEAEFRLFSRVETLARLSKLKRKHEPAMVVGPGEEWLTARAGMALTPLMWGEEEGGINPLAF